MNFQAHFKAAYEKLPCVNGGNGFVTARCLPRTPVMRISSAEMRETMVTAIVGANWGDEGKGKITDMLGEESDIIVRFQGEVMQAIPLSMIMANLPCTCYHPESFTGTQQVLSATALH